jgi:ABC-2 type transport system permease protein
MEVAVRLADGFLLADVVRGLDAEGLSIADIELRAPTLDDVLPRQDGAVARGLRCARGPLRHRGRGRADPRHRPAMTAVATQMGAIAQRSVRRTLRQPAAIVFPLVFPILLLLVNTGGLKASTALPGFPTDSFLAFALAVPFIQGALFATMNAGTDLARDIQTGFLNRLALTPIRGSALLAGTLAGIVVMGVAQAIFYLAVGIVFGVEFAAGPAGVPVLLGFAALVALGFGALGSFLALRTGSGEAVQAFFPVFFVFLLISSMNTPRDLIAVDWFRFVATINPVSYLLECVRSLIVEGWDWTALALGFGIATAILVVSVSLAAWALTRRMERT